MYTCTYTYPEYIYTYTSIVQLKHCTLFAGYQRLPITWTHDVVGDEYGDRIDRNGDTLRFFQYVSLETVTKNILNSIIFSQTKHVYVDF